MHPSDPKALPSINSLAVFNPLKTLPCRGYLVLNYIYYTFLLIYFQYSYDVLYYSFQENKQMAKRTVKSISLADEGQVDRLEMAAIAVARSANQQQKELMPEGNISRMNQLIADNHLGVVWKDWGEFHAPILEMVKKQQPFRIVYSDVQGKNWGFTVMYAEIVERMYKMGHIRPYLDCWCVEESGNMEIPELSHNWNFRIDADHYASAEIEPVKEKWRSQGRDFVDVVIEFSGGLAWGYEGHPDDREDSGKSNTRTITRRITSSYWLMRELAPHIICHPGSVRILEPEGIRQKYSL